MKTILAPVDFSRVSRQVVEHALELAGAIGARVVVLHVVKTPSLVTDVAPLVGEAVQITAEVDRSARRHLRELRTRLARSGVAVETVCEQGMPLPFILSHAKRLDADYIVIGSHGHGAFYDLVVGSTASGVLKRSTCPVVVVAPVSKRPARRIRRAEIPARAAGKRMVGPQIARGEEEGGS